MFNNLSSLTEYFKSRRSSRPRNMIAPGPSDAQIAKIVKMAMRTPDHGKLAPWRVVSVAQDQRSALAETFVAAYKKEKAEARRLELEGLENMAKEAPALLVILFSPVESTKIPIWEQQLSCGAFCMNILHAVHAEGFVGGWISGWPAYNDDVRDAFGQAPEKIAGFIFAGSPKEELTERRRPEIGDVLSRWKGKPAA